MLKGVIYINVFLLSIMSIYFITISNKNYNNLRNLKKLIIVYILYTFISMYICYSSEIVETEWDVFYLIPLSIISLIIYIINICRINKLLKNNNIVSNNQPIKYIVFMVVPAILFIFAYSFELYIINKCDYLLKYNYQDGIITSEDTYIAIIDDMPLSVTLQKNPFDRKGKLYDGENYEIIYSDTIEISTRNSYFEKEIISNKKIEKIALDAKEKSKDAMSAYIYYLPDGEYAIIELLSDKGSGIVLGEYFYHNGKYVKKVRTNGTIDSVIHYNR